VLLDYGANGVDGLVAACDNQDDQEHPEIIPFFLDQGIDVNGRASISQVALQDDNRMWAGRTALEIACTKDDPTIVRMLLDHGADPNLRSPGVESALEAYLNRPYNDLKRLEHVENNENDENDENDENEATPIFGLLLEYGADLGLLRENILIERSWL
ncbi:MAG: hypothetical protein Q9198_006555, partial [Flavoplaca austrocitrina]